MFWEKKFEEISKILLTVLKGFKENLEVLENFNITHRNDTRKCTLLCMHSIVFSKDEHCTLIVYITEFFLKSGGGAKCITAPPPSKIWGGHGPLALPPVADPMSQWYYYWNVKSISSDMNPHSATLRTANCVHVIHIITAPVASQTPIQGCKIKFCWKFVQTIEEQFFKSL